METATVIVIRLEMGIKVVIVIWIMIFDRCRDSDYRELYHG